MRHFIKRQHFEIQCLLGLRVHHGQPLVGRGASAVADEPRWQTVDGELGQVFTHGLFRSRKPGDVTGYVGPVNILYADIEILQCLRGLIHVGGGVQLAERGQFIGVTEARVGQRQPGIAVDIQHRSVIPARDDQRECAGQVTYIGAHQVVRSFVTDHVDKPGVEYLLDGFGVALVQGVRRQTQGIGQELFGEEVGDVQRVDGHTPAGCGVTPKHNTGYAGDIDAIDMPFLAILVEHQVGFVPDGRRVHGQVRVVGDHGVAACGVFAGNQPGVAAFGLLL